MTSLLAVDTSSEACSVALRLGDDVRERHEHAPLRHAELLLPAIRGLLAEGGVSLSSLDAIAFGRGPGSFTSLRIGIGVVQGLAWAAGLPVVPVASLAAVAQMAAERAGGGSDRIQVAVDARMQEVFSAAFVVGRDGLVKPAGEERVGPPEAILDAMDPPYIAAGNGFACFDELHAAGQAAVACFPELLPHAAIVARLALGWLQENEPLSAARAQPVYVRNKVADKPGGS